MPMLKKRDFARKAVESIITYNLSLDGSVLKGIAALIQEPDLNAKSRRNSVQALREHGFNCELLLKPNG